MVLCVFWHFSCHFTCVLTWPSPSCYVVYVVGGTRTCLCLHFCIFLGLRGVGGGCVGWGGCNSVLVARFFVSSNTFLELQTRSWCYASNRFLELQTRSWCYASNRFLELQTRSWYYASNRFLELQTRSWCYAFNRFLELQTRLWCYASNRFLELQTRSWCYVSNAWQIPAGNRMPNGWKYPMVKCVIKTKNERKRFAKVKARTFPK